MTAVTNIKIGSVISFGSADTPELFTVKGFVEEPFLGASPIGTKRFFISDSDFERIYGNTDELYFGKASDIGVNLTEDADFVTVKKELNDMCGLISSSFITLSKAETTYYTKIYQRSARKSFSSFLSCLL